MVSAIPLVVCDDSNMARKQLIRALPAEWPVSITQAANGREALAALEQGLGEVMLLDLTMPEMDGFETLAQIRQRGLQTRVVVVSGDVQEEAVRRVLALGALDFVKKPADPEVMRQVLDRHGLLRIAPSSPAVDNARPDPDVSFRDAFREVINVSMGRAAALLGRVLNVFVELPIPNINILEVGELHMALADVERGGKLSAVCQGYIGEGIAGEALLIFHDSEIAEMSRLMRWKAEGEQAEVEMLLDLSSVLIGACLAGLAEQMDLSFSQGPPAVLGQQSSIEELITINQKRWKKTLAVEISYGIEGHRIHFDLLLLFTEDSVKRLTHKIHYLMN